ncbi:MAG: hypothetical protein K0U93_11860, partial [Gammaproteobacteria bacterium]|nr:hypothetical protein [Gammaproteobacteria bacterium]
MHMLALSALMPSLRQFRYPKAWRIDPPSAEIDDGTDDFERRVAQVQALISAAADTRGADATTWRPEDKPQLAELGTRLWRLRTGMVTPGTDTPVQGAERSYRHLGKATDALQALGVEVIDRAGAAYDSGMIV